MNEAQWLKCTRPDAMLESLKGASDRKLRLFAVACCRGLWLTDERANEAVEIAERFADGLADRKELGRVRGEMKAKARDGLRKAALRGARAEGLSDDDAEARGVTCAASWDAARHATRAAARDAADLVARTAAVARRWGKSLVARQADPCRLLRCVFGNPFRPVPFDAAWRTKTATGVARVLYDERRFQDLPVLADALEEAGCTDAEILSHLRGLGPHVRGCWALDLILGTS